MQPLDERAAAGVAVAAAGAGHLLDQHTSAGLDRVVQDLGVGAVVLLADVLTDLEGADGVEGRPAGDLGDLPVVLQPDLEAVRQAALVDALVDELLLLGGDGHANDLDAVVLGGVQGKRAPAAADVEEAHARREAELGADQVELVPLRVLERVRRVRRAEVGRRVGHLRLEDQRVELVGQVVVVADRTAVAQLAVQTATDARLRGGQRRRPADGADVERGAERAAEGTR